MSVFVDRASPWDLRFANYTRITCQRAAGTGITSACHHTWLSMCRLGPTVLHFIDWAISLERVYFLFLYYLLCVCMCGHIVLGYMCGGQRKTCESQFSPISFYLHSLPAPTYFLKGSWKSERDFGLCHVSFCIDQYYLSTLEYC